MHKYELTENGLKELEELKDQLDVNQLRNPHSGLHTSSSVSHINNLPPGRNIHIV